jgi:subtilisin family serine protease
MAGWMNLNGWRARRRLAAAALLGSVALWLTLTASARGTPPEHTGEVLVRFRGDALPFRKFPAGGTSSLEAVAAAWARRPGVLWAEPNGWMERCAAPDDPGYPLQWHLDNPVHGGIHVEAAWQLIQGEGKIPGAGATVAVIDTGLAFEANGRFARCPDFPPERVAPGFNFLAGSTHPNDDNGHGTHVAGTIGASTNDGIGCAGIAYGATILPLKALDRRGRGAFDRIATAIRYAVDHQADVINLSLGASKGSRAVSEAIRHADSRGVLVVAAAGNAGRRRAFYPAAYPAAIAVSATRYDQTPAPYSNFGAGVDLAAPGGDLLADQNGDGRPTTSSSFPSREIPPAFSSRASRARRWLPRTSRAWRRSSWRWAGEAARRAPTCAPPPATWAPTAGMRATATAWSTRRPPSAPLSLRRDSMAVRGLGDGACRGTR